MANIIYRISDSADIPSATAVKNSPLTNLEVDGNFRSLKESLESKSPTNSPTFFGVPVAPTAPLGTISDQIATTAFVQAAIDDIDIPPPPVTSVAGKTGAITLAKSDVGLSNVDNTADSAKNVLSATKLTTARTIELTGDATGSASFDGSANASLAVTVQDNSHAHTIANVTGLQAALDSKQGRYTTTSTATSKTLVNLERCLVTAAGQTITLPTSPSNGWEVTVIVGDFTNTVINRNGQTIMGISENMTIDRPNVALSFLFVSGSGWRII